MIVKLVAINMVNVTIIIWIRNKCFRNNPMHTPSYSLAIS